MPELLIQATKGNMSDTQLTQNKPQLEPIDPFRASLDCLIVIAFPRSTSKNFGFALSIAEGAERYAVMTINGKPMHVAAFAKTQADAGRATALLGYIANWKGSLLFSRGRMLQSAYQVSQVIECFLDSCSCRNQEAYCHSIIDDPFSPIIQDLGMSFSFSITEKPSMKELIQIDRYAFPCKFLLRYFHFEKDHPSSPEDQIQAAGVRYGCNVCPNFNADNFKMIGVRTVQRDAFE
jgi:hypothetical protein